jgi:hypothetical protein
MTNAIGIPGTVSTACRYGTSWLLINVEICPRLSQIDPATQRQWSECSKKGAHCSLVINRACNEANQPYGSARKQRGTWKSSTKPLLEDSTMINPAVQPPDGYSVSQHVRNACQPAKSSHSYGLHRQILHRSKRGTMSGHTQQTCGTHTAVRRMQSSCRRTHARVHERNDSQHTGPAGWHAMSSSRFTPAV